MPDATSFPLAMYLRPAARAWSTASASGSVPRSFASLTSSGTRRLHPPLVAASCFEPIISYSGEDGLRGAFRETNCRIGYVLSAEPGLTIDVDTPEDYARVQQHFSSKGKQEAAT